MADLLTTRQLQELLQVDRVTIYRMLSDGRLTGFKVGGQWRFSRQEIEKWLQEQRAALAIAETSNAIDEDGSPSNVLPLSCIQAVQSVYAEALGIAAVTTNQDGSPFTTVSNSCRFCNLVLATDEGRRRCATSWQVPTGSRGYPPPIRTCHAGLLCLSIPIQVDEDWIANVASCQFATRPPEGVEGAWLRNVPTLAAELGLAEDELQAAAEGMHTLDESELPRIARLLQQVANTLAEIVQERAKLVDRLRRIAEMTNV